LTDPSVTSITAAAGAQFWCEFFLARKPHIEKKGVMGVYKTEGGLPAGRIDTARVDATTEADIKRHIEADEHAALSDAGVYARRIRKRLGLTQVQLAAKLDVPLDTLWNWEQGKRYPTGPAKALLKILDRSPEAALAALNDTP
jgi:putative transcriptional regulator